MSVYGIYKRKRPADVDDRHNLSEEGAMIADLSIRLEIAEFEVRRLRKRYRCDMIDTLADVREACPSVWNTIEKSASESLKRMKETLANLDKNRKGETL